MLGLLLAVQFPMPGLPPDESFPPGARYAEVLASPPESDVYRFPPRCVCTAARRANAAYRANLEAERCLWPASQQWKFDAAIGEAHRGFAAWDKLDDLHCWESSLPWWRRRLILGELRTLLGQENFDAGVMPDPIPRTWLRELR